MKRPLLILMMLTLVLSGVTFASLIDAPAAEAQEYECTQGELVGDQCRIVGDPPVTGPGTCPEKSQGTAPDCYTLERGDPSTFCQAPYAISGGRCIFNGSITSPSSCPPVPGKVISAANEKAVHGFLTCSYSPPDFELFCPTGTTAEAPPSEFCRRPVAPIPGGPVCEEGFDLEDRQCIRWVPADIVFRPGRAIVSYDASCGADGKVGLTAITTATENGAQIVAITINGSANTGTRIDPGAPINVQVLTTNPSDQIVVNGPSTAPTCAGPTPTSGPTPTPAPTPTSGPTPTPAPTPTPGPTSTPTPTPTVASTPSAQTTPEPTTEPTSTPAPVATPDGENPVNPPIDVDLDLVARRLECVQGQLVIELTATASVDDVVLEWKLDGETIGEPGPPGTRRVGIDGDGELHTASVTILSPSEPIEGTEQAFAAGFAADSVQADRCGNPVPERITATTLRQHGRSEIVLPAACAGADVEIPGVDDLAPVTNTADGSVVLATDSTRLEVGEHIATIDCAGNRIEVAIFVYHQIGGSRGEAGGIVVASAAGLTGLTLVGAAARRRIF